MDQDADEYREKNFAREALTVNPAKACQPLGAVFAAVGFEQTLPFVHGSQGCVAYYRSHFSRHFKEPTSCVSSSMTEDAAVFGGLNNMIDGLANTYNMYKPKMIAVSTTCMAEVIGDDLNAFIKTAKEKGSVPQEFDVPFAHTPAFVGSHITGYDNVMKGIVEHFWDGKASTEPKLERVPNEKINFIGGFDGYTVGNLREIKRIFNSMQRRLYDPWRQQRRLGYADRWRVPHVRRRHDPRRGGQCAPRQGHHLDAGILHRKNAEIHRNARATRPSRSITRWACAAPMSS